VLHEKESMSFISSLIGERKKMNKINRIKSVTIGKSCGVYVEEEKRESEKVMQ
jgi:hypothetical protein